MTVHKLKTEPGPFQSVLDGVKTFEIRVNDRNYQVGDHLSLQEIKQSYALMRAGAPLIYTGREIDAKVVGIMQGVYGLQPGWCILSIKVVGKPSRVHQPTGLNRAEIQALAAIARNEPMPASMRQSIAETAAVASLVNIDTLAKAFALWEQSYRDEASNFMTREEMDAMEVAPLAMQSAIYFNALMRQVMDAK